MKREYITGWGGNSYIMIKWLLSPIKKWSEKDFDTAARLAAWLLKSGRLDFVHGEKPRTAAEFIGGAPYISEGFEGVSGCGFRASWEIVDKSARYHTTLSHLLLAVVCGVFVWDVYDAKTGKCGVAYEMVQL